VRRALAPRRSLAGEQGSAVVLTLVLLATLTSGSVIWMTRELSSTVAARTLAMEVAHQSARAGAQQLDEGALRTRGEVRVDARAAEEAVVAEVASARQSLVAGDPFTLELVGVAVDGARVTTEIEVRGAGAPVTVSGRAWAMGEGDR
jgi:hypothetical protein